MSDDRDRNSKDPFDMPLDARLEAELDALFAEARDDAPEPLPAQFRDRLLGAALAAQPERPVSGWLIRLRGMLADFGGGPSLAGVGAAGIAGLWIGIAAPGPTADLVTSFWQGASSVTAGASAWNTDGTGLDFAGAELLTLLDSETD
ncbi:hypothetical protein JI664_00170 [Rhodobacter sp. NTK016B]|uniref:hypothetical protein n=1 Tax=Rhodobacter sp. NTK016B TaxID=2759676 RepID=UPI001A8E9D31|nr:hypothetical protein [Rhodobacter sp. NTK016B]MBN8290371.1 hypothetical protein [Rhodobacter sp. NTK016B]